MYSIEAIQSDAFFTSLTLSRPRLISYRNQSIDLLCKSMDWLLYDIDLRRERVKWAFTTQKHIWNFRVVFTQNILINILKSVEEF